MKKITIATFISTTLIALASFANDKKDSHWEYKGHEGPENWGKLSEKWEKCENGHNQSPIDLKWKKPSKDRKIEFHYSSSPFKVLNNGHTVQASFSEGNYAIIDGEKFNLLQLHFHAHSEHSISKKFYPLEMHLVHADKNGKLAVVGIFFEEGKENKELNHIFNSIPEKNNHEVSSHEKININEMIPGVKTHYHYMGSLTTPPCSEGVNWNVFNTPIFASSAQIEKFTKHYADNYRPVQKLNGRVPANF